MQRERIDIVRGDALAIPIDYRDDAGEPFDASGYTARAQVRHKASDADALLDFDVDLTDADEGRFVLRAAPAETAELPGGSHVWDLEISIGAAPLTIVGGVFYVTADVTR